MCAVAAPFLGLRATTGRDSGWLTHAPANIHGATSQNRRNSLG